MSETNNRYETLDKKLWKANDKLRKNIDAAEYKHVVLGLVFLKYISEVFNEYHHNLIQEGVNAEDKERYKEAGIFYVPPEARWAYLQTKTKDQDIGQAINKAMDLIEQENPRLAGVLPKIYANNNLDPVSLAGLIDLFSDITLKDAQIGDVLGHVFEYFLGQFAALEAKRGGQYYTPRSIVELLVEMVEPRQGKVYDPCCGSGGMFVYSEQFIERHKANPGDIVLYGQESNQATWRLCKMNLEMRGIDSSNIIWNSEGSFLNDAHPDLKADYILANPPFNDSDWHGELLREDKRWVYGTPPVNNANYAWIQHFLYHLADNGTAGFVMTNGSLSAGKQEGEIRKRIIEDHRVDCIVSLPDKLFLNTQIPACIWILRTNKQKRRDEVLFIDASNMGHLINRATRELSSEDIEQIANTYHNWRNGTEQYHDIPGFCKSATLEEIRNNEYVLIPARYIDANIEEETITKEQLDQLIAEFEKEIEEEQELNKTIINNLKRLKINE